jgi:putative DNA primase/helicase
MTTKQHVPDDAELADRWIMYNRQTAWGIGDWRRYADGVWLPVDRDTIKRDITKSLERAQHEGVRVTNGLINSVMEIARTKVAIANDRWDADPDYLPCKNGVLHIPTKSLLPHTPDIYATSQLDYDYDPAATCPAFIQALQRIPDVIDFLQEFAGYALTTEVKHEIAVWFHGTIGSGKSTIIEGLQVMVGKKRHGILGLAQIERSRFALANLPGKTLVTSFEQPESFMSAAHILNSIISGEAITVEQKFKDEIVITPRAKILWAMNDLPRVSNVNNGIMRRVKVIEFPPLPEGERNVDLKEQIKLEGAGILNWALMGLDRLNARGKFAPPQCVLDATRDYQEKNDIPALFLEEINAHIDKTDPQCRTTGQYLYDQYSDWCKRNNHKPMSSTRIAEEWKRLGFERQRIRGVTYWQGVEITPFVAATNAYSPSFAAMP